MENLEKLDKIFKIFSFLDDFRWKCTGNYNLINFYRNDLDDDSKILTHWLCYISDRQMPFEIIWDVGGFVFSEIVQEIKKTKNITILNPAIKDSFIKKDDKDGKYYFLSKTDANDKIIKKYESYIKKQNKVRFKSRYVPTDYVCILSTFVILEEFNYKLSEYISHNLSKHKNEDDIIIRLLFSLYLLTYFDIGQPNSNDLSNYEEILGEVKSRKESVMKILNDKQMFDEKLHKFKQKGMFFQKRAWCSLRDFIKSKEFYPYFRNAMLQCDVKEEEINSLTTKKSLEQFVLPGDVWNNNSVFRKCIFEKTLYEKSNKTLNIILDEYFRQNHPKTGYPEQFDVTFDFVPRMCKKNNCDICPIKNIDEKNAIEEVCINNKEKYCTVALHSCNYKGSCVGKDKCKIFN
jgi:hypothetical protein